MNVQCLIGRHTWSGCTAAKPHEERCERCGKARPTVAHAWDGCRCAKCTLTRDESHAWQGCTCAKCKKNRNESHTWDGCVCTTCRKTRDAEHAWNVCQCSRCGKTRDDMHAWDGCVCAHCRRSRDQEHSWDVCRCLKCKQVRYDGHIWFRGAAGAGPESCKRCGHLRPVIHTVRLFGIVKRTFAEREAEILTRQMHHLGLPHYSASNVPSNEEREERANQISTAAAQAINSPDFLRGLDDQLSKKGAIVAGDLEVFVTAHGWGNIQFVPGDDWQSYTLRLLDAHLNGIDRRRSAGLKPENLKTETRESEHSLLVFSLWVTVESPFRWT